MTRLDFEVESDTGILWQVRCRQAPLLQASGFNIADALEAAAKELRNLSVKVAQDKMLGMPASEVFRTNAD